MITEAFDAVETGGTPNLEKGRRAFIASLGATSVGAAIFAAADGSLTEAYAQSVNDVAIVTFALNFEYLGATFYLTALTGQGLSDSDIGPNPGRVIGGRQSNFTNAIVKAAITEFAIDERSHVRVLRAALGSQVAPRPNIDIGASFTLAARAAGIVSPTGTFDPYASDNNLLLAAYIFEDVCVTALKGSAALIQDKGILTTAAGFLAVEAYQAGTIRSLLFAQQNQSLVNATMAISGLRSSLANNGNPNVDDYGIGTVGSPHIVNADANAIVFGRTPRQVLNIAYGSVNAAGGQFFPNGVNGSIR